VFADPRAISNIFGWMMLYLATLTVNLAWQGWLSLRNKQQHSANRAWHNLLSQLLLTAASTNCFVRGAIELEPMMMGISMVGFATVATNLWFIYKPHPLPTDRIKEHIKCLVGAGISVYTAFFAFGAVRLLPELALQPGLWAVPLIVGLALIIYHQRKVTRPASRKWKMV
jgi:O-antigen/teichoic acid export membrane protein